MSDLIQAENLLKASYGHEISAYEIFVPYTEFAAQVRYVGIADDTDPIDRESVLTQVNGLYDSVSTLLKSTTQNEPSNEFN